MKIKVVSVPVSDQDRAKEFYVEKLGFGVVFDNPHGPDKRWVMLTPPGGGTAITLVTWFPTMPPGSMKGLVYEVDDVDAVHAELSGKGLAVSAVETAPWGRHATLDDPDGNGIVLQEYPKS
ncbi:MAG: VOC family protein [Kutzneria sp.]|nr:VOC family protein [Kutzneria sp.]MBV9845976.1 VOC family protein [Kutzneria sp.]